MKGYWLGRSQAIFATQKTPYGFDKLSHSLNRRGNNSYTRQYFVPQFQCTEDFRSKNIPVEEQLDSDVLNDLATSVDFNTDAQNEDLNKAWKKARIEKTQVDTKLAGEKLEQRKKYLFYEWSEKFFDSFSNHFGRLKNTLVQMHLNQEQVKSFNSTLEKCLQNMQLDLNSIYNQFMQEKEDED